MSAKILRPTDSGAIKECVDALTRSELVAVPTETVYGLAALATDKVAISKIFSVKSRPPSHPLILHIADESDLEFWATDISETAKKLVGEFWPGPLTVIFNRSDKVCDEITGGRQTVAIRCPSHDVTRNLLLVLGSAIVAPSANKFGKVSPTSAQHVVEDLGDEIDLILDGGECTIGLESTVVDCTTHPPQLLRAGAISVEQIRNACRVTVVEATGENRAPGMLDKHYAPNCRVVLAADDADAERQRDDFVKQGKSARVLDHSTDLERYAHVLYDSLRQADHDKIDVIVAVLAQNSGLGRAINDRLSKAANSFK